MRKITAIAAIGPESLYVKEFEVSANVTTDEIAALAQTILGVSDDEDWWWTDDPDPFGPDVDEEGRELAQDLQSH